MTSENNTESKRTQRRINPAVCTPDALARALGTDTVKGLSQKEASRRTIRAESASLFASGTLTPKKCAALLCREVTLWLFLAFGAVALFFGRVAIGLVCTGLTIGYSVFCIWMYAKSEAADAAMSVYDRSFCRVIRGGRERRVSADGVVQGDLLLLSVGDLVPADARLLAASPDFTVTERELEGKESLRHAVRLVKDASAHIEPGGRHTHSPENMVFAGGIVESGQARAIAVAIGHTTHLAGLNGQIQPSRPVRRPESDRAQDAVRRLIGYILLFLTIPLTVVGYLTLGDKYDLLDIVLAVTSLSALSLRTPALVKEMMQGAAVRRKAASGRNTDNTADIRTAVILDKLTDMDELVLSGTAGLHDGMLHPETLLTGGRTYDCTHPADSDTPKRFVEGMYLIREGLKTQTEPADLTDTIHAEHGIALVGLLCGWCEPERASMELRVDNVTAYVKGDTHPVLTHVTAVGKSGVRVTYRLTDAWEAVLGCTHLADGNGARLMTSEDMETVRTFVRQTQLSGYRYVYLLSESDGSRCLEGCLAFGPHTSRKTAGAVKALESAGIRVTAFLKNVSDENTRVLSECGLTADTPADRPAEGAERTAADAVRDTGVRAFEGCSVDYILTYIKSRRANGKRVAVLTGEGEDLALLSAADVSFTVSPSLYMLTVNGKTVAEPGRFIDADGTPDSECATDLCRRRADIIVRRATEEGGGMEGVRTAIRTALHYRSGLKSLRCYALCSQLLRVLTLLLHLCSGMSLPGAPLLLVSGMVLDMIVLLAFCGYSLPTEANVSKSLLHEAGKRSLPQSRDFVKYPRAFLPEAVAACVCAIVPWLTALIVSAFSPDFGASLSYYAVLTLFAGQVAICIPDRNLRGRWRQGIPVMLVVICAYVAALAVVLGADFDLRRGLLFPLTAFPAYLAALYLMKGIGRLTKPRKE